MIEVHIHVSDIDRESMNRFMRENSGAIRRAVNAHFQQNFDSKFHFVADEPPSTFSSSMRQKFRTLLHRRWTPTDAQLRRITELIFRSESVCDLCLKVVTIAIAIYLAVEIGAAFLPGGAVERVLGGGAK
jgi:hypothetical protein